MNPEEYNNLKVTTLSEVIQKIENLEELERFASYVIAPLAKTLPEDLRQWLRDEYLSRKVTLSSPSILGKVLKKGILDENKSSPDKDT